MKKHFIFTALAITGFSMIMASCLKSPQIEYSKEKEEADLQWFLEENDITTPPLASGLYYLEIEEGTGETPDTGDVVSIFYVGKFISGYIFDMNVNGLPLPITVGTGQVIPGLEEGLFLMKKGGSATLIIPSELAYGETGVPGVIPPFSTLIFDVEIFDISVDK